MLIFFTPAIGMISEVVASTAAPTLSSNGVEGTSYSSSYYSSSYYSSSYSYASDSTSLDTQTGSGGTFAAGGSTNLSTPASPGSSCLQHPGSGGCLAAGDEKGAEVKSFPFTVSHVKPIGQFSQVPAEPKRNDTFISDGNSSATNMLWPFNTSNATNEADPFDATSGWQIPWLNITNGTQASFSNAANGSNDTDANATVLATIQHGFESAISDAENTVSAVDNDLKIIFRTW